MAQPRSLPPLETLREVLAYDPDTGALTWRVDRSNQVKAGAPAGCHAGSHGYTQVRLGPRILYAHRLAWYMHHGTDPGPAQVDHINRNRSDNRASNLRLVDAKGNRANTRFVLPSNSHPVQVIYPSGEARLFPSVTDAARALGCSRTSICHYVKGRRSRRDGLVVRYADLGPGPGSP